jgi:hypothetical protein
MENVFSLLRQDHARLRAFTRGYEPANSTRDLARQWAIHFLSEENFLFPRLASEAEVRPLLRRLSETHALVREDVRELLAAEAAAAKPKAEALRDTLRRAVDFEEESFLQKAEQLIPPEEAEAMAREVQEFREELRLTLDAA